VLPALAVIAVSVLVAGALGSMNRELIAAVGGTILFVLLVRDLRIIVPVAVFLIPLGPKFAMSFGNLYLATAVLIIAYMAWFWRQPLTPAPFTFRVDALGLTILFLLLVMFLASLQSIPFLLANRTNLLRFVQFIIYTGFFFMVRELRIGRRWIEILLGMILAAALIQGVIGAYQWISSPGFYVTGTFDDRHTNFAIYIVFMLFLFMGVLLESRKLWQVLFAAAGTGVLAYALVFSFARGGYVAFAGALPLMFFMPFSRRKKAGLVLFLAGGTALVFALVPPDVMMRANTILANISGSDVGISFGDRLKMWA
jgi:O-antigen ligase